MCQVEKKVNVMPHSECNAKSYVICFERLLNFLFIVDKRDYVVTWLLFETVIASTSNVAACT